MEREGHYADYGSKIFLTKEVKELDRLTLQFQNITEAALIARAAQAFFDAIFKGYPPQREVFMFCGPGNNGNDGRALGLLLAEAGYRVTRYDLGSDDATPLPASACRKRGQMPDISDSPPSPSDSPLIIDSLFGAGLNRPLEGVAAAWVRWMNSASGVRIALDIPSGWHGEENVLWADEILGGEPQGKGTFGNEGVGDESLDGGESLDGAAIVRAHLTLTLDVPKLSFFFPESAPYIGEWQVVPLGLSPQAMATIETPYRMVSPERLNALLQPLPKFLHKGAAGRVRLLAGSPGMMGAAALAAKAAYRTGAGWVEVSTPKTEMHLLQMMVPEVIVRDVNESDAATNSVASIYTSMAYGAGPGMGTSNTAVKNLQTFLPQHTLPTTGRRAIPFVLDADSLNILSAHPDLWQRVPHNTIITPHPGEFKRLVGAWENDYQRLQLQRRFATQHQVIVVVKGAHTSIALPNGMVYFNVSGNPGMATAGSGDVLTGILLGLLAQGLSPQESAILGVYLHGLAGDLAAEAMGQRSVMASDISEYIGRALCCGYS